MSTANRTRYEVQKIISDAVKSGLSSYIGASHGFSVMEFAQATFAAADKIVLLNPIRVSRIGWQTEDYPVVSSALTSKTEWVEEQRWQIHVILKRNASPAITDMLADDVANILVTWFNGKGCEYFRSYGCANLRISQDDIHVYEDNSELYQKRAVFTLKLQVPKTLSMAQDEIASIVPDIKPV